MIATYFLNKVVEVVHDFDEANLTHLAVGTDDTAPSQTDTALGNEVLRKSRQEYSRDDTNGTFVVSMWINTLEANGNDLKEVGVFDSDSGGNLYTREIFDTISKTSDMEIWIDIEYTTTVSEV